VGLYDRLCENPFNVIDDLSWKIKGKEINFLKDDTGVRKEALYFGLACFVAWMICGWDSTPLQLIHSVYEGIPALLQGGSWADVVVIYNSYYGKEMHYSAFVIYFILFWALSKSWSQAGVKGFKNVAYSFTAMFLSIAVFEWFWILGFSYFQNQPWVSTWAWPQFKILFQNTVFTIVGVLGSIYIWIDSYIIDSDNEITGRNWNFRLKEWAPWILVFSGVAAALLWIFYPWDVQLLTVTLDSGEVWESSRLFPQTLYTIDLNPADSFNSGVWFWIENNLIHGVNTLVKSLWAIATYLLFRVKKCEKI